MAQRPPNPERAALMRDKNYVWLMAGAIVTMLGDQFTLIALPWLVLRMTGDTLVLGIVLGLMSLPRALFILLGGAVVDRYSPKRVLMITKYVNTVLLAALAALVLVGGLSLWAVYALAFAIGLATAFSIPSGTSMLPHVVPRTQLAAANSMMMGMRQLSMFLGPLLAGLLIAVFGDGTSSSGDVAAVASGVVTDAHGLGLAFGLAAPSQPVLSAVMAGLRHLWSDRDMRLCFIYWGVVAVLITGPVQIAIPVLVSTQNLGAAALGILAGAHGAGTLAGMVVSGARPGLRLGTLGMTMLAVDVVVGLLFMPMARRGPAGHHRCAGRIHASSRLHMAAASHPAGADGARHEHVHVHLPGPGATVGRLHRLAAARHHTAPVVHGQRRPAGVHRIGRAAGLTGAACDR